MGRLTPIRCLIVFIILALSALAYAISLPVLGGHGPRNHCYACTTLDADLACEDFEHAGAAPTCAGWTINDDGDGSVTFEAHPAAIATCTDEGSYAMKIDRTADVDQFAEFATGGDPTVIYIQGWFYVASEGLADEDLFVLIEGAQSQETGQSFRVMLEQEDDGGAHLVLTVGYWNTVPDFVYQESAVTVTASAWHRIIVGYDDSDFLKVWLDQDATGAPDISIDAATLGGAGKEVSYVYFGSYIAGEELHTVWWDNIKIDATAAPGNCL